MSLASLSGARFKVRDTLQIDTIKKRFEEVVTDARARLEVTMSQLNEGTKILSADLASSFQKLKADQVALLLSLGDDAHQKVLNTQQKAPVVLQQPFSVIADRLNQVLETLRASSTVPSAPLVHESAAPQAAPVLTVVSPEAVSGVEATEKTPAKTVSKKASSTQTELKLVGKSEAKKTTKKSSTASATSSKASARKPTAKAPAQKKRLPAD